MSIRSILVAGSLIGVVSLAGCSNKASAQKSKRDADRTVLQIEDLTNQRNVLKEELDKLRMANVEMQKQLTDARQQLAQASDSLSRANNDLSSARVDSKSMESFRTEIEMLRAQLAASKAQLSAVQAELKANGAPASAEQRSLSTPSTQPGMNK